MGGAHSSAISRSRQNEDDDGGGGGGEVEEEVEMPARTTRTTTSRTTKPEREEDEEEGGGGGSGGGNNEAMKDEERGEEEDEREGDEEENSGRVVASCRVCLEPIRLCDLVEMNSSGSGGSNGAEATLLGCKCAGVGIHLNRECGLKYLKNLRRPNQALTVCEVCQSPMSEFAEKIRPVLSTSESESPFSLHDRDGFIHTLTRPRRRPSEWCEFFCFLVPCLPCIALASTNCFHFLCISAMRFRAYIFVGVILAVLIIFLSDVYLSMESKFKSREREQRKDTYDTGNDSGYNSDYYHHSGWRGRESRPMFGGRGGGWNSFYYDA